MLFLMQHSTLQFFLSLYKFTYETFCEISFYEVTEIIGIIDIIIVRKRLILI